MFDESEMLAGNSVQTGVNEQPTNGLAAEPGLAEHSRKTEKESGTPTSAAPGLELSGPFEVRVADLEWSSRGNDPDELKSLAASLSIMQINDIIVTPRTTTGKYGVIAGNRRCAAAALDGLPLLRARIYQGGAGDIVSIVENAQRMNESPKSMLLRLRKALQGGADRKEIRAFLGATGKARSTISDLLYGALLDQDRFQKMIDSANVFKAIAELRSRKSAAAPVSLFAAAGEKHVAPDDPENPGRSVTEQVAPASAEPALALRNGTAHALEQAKPIDDRVETAPVSADGTPSGLEPKHGPGSAESNGEDLVEESIAAADPLRDTLSKPAASCWATPAELTELPLVQQVVMHPLLCLPLADAAQTEEEKLHAGAWCVALIRPAQSPDVPVNARLARKAVWLLGRCCRRASKPRP
jgi:hypothetical protein